MQPVIIHDSRNTFYRFPFGAVEAGSVVTLRCEVEGDGAEKVTLRLWQEGAGETLHIMQNETQQNNTETKPEKDAGQKPGTVRQKQICQCSITVPETGCLLWYYFIIEAKDKIFYYGNNAEQTGGWGQLYEDEPPSFQVTVYDHNAKTPDWLKHAVFYQIFPDRFNRGNVPLSQFSGKPNALLHGNWNDRPRYIKNPETGEITYYDFFGGTLQGIREKLDYLTDLGITCLYLNPVFESRSNHHYDTGNYKKIDSFLGTEEDFAALCQDAKEQGIQIILDGVFSHTGDDSIYFNRKGTYPGTGAYQSETSPYHSWYRFTEFPEEYSCWWGDKSLPEVEETAASYQDFIIRDPDSVLKRWMRAGISGWRLDVADELPDEFLQAFYSELKKTSPDGALIGEVWEDASHKISYGKQRAYLCGGKLDSVMNYVLRKLMLDFLLGRADAGRTNTLYMQQMENYPKENMYAMLNLAGSHDVERILSLLEDNISGSAKTSAAVTAAEEHSPVNRKLCELKKAAGSLPEQAELSAGEQRLLLFWAWQMTLPGAPCLYYGDEAGVQGGKDPDNRRPFPWGKENKKLQEACRAFIRLRNRHHALRTGRMIPVYAEGDVYIYARSIEGGRDVFGAPAEDGLFFVMLNRGKTSRTVRVYTGELAFGEMQSVGPVKAEPVSVVNGIFTVTLPPLSQNICRCVEQGHRDNVNKPKEKKSPVDVLGAEPRKRAGILLHPTSLCGENGKEKIQAAKEWIDFLAAAGQKVWQILPLNPPGLGNSPYLSASAFAGHETLFEEDNKTETFNQQSNNKASGNAAHKTKESERKTGNALLKTNSVEYNPVDASLKTKRSYQEFCEQNSYWLPDYALYRALQDHFHHAPWQEWPEEVRKRAPKALKKYKKLLAEPIEICRQKQFKFACAWKEIKTYANAKGISILGDMPIFVAADSADCWAHPEYFYLDDAGNPAEVAGVPPDYFSATGQIWGNPLYRWDVMEKDGFRWWKERFRATMQFTDIIRVDHFRGFVAAWAVPRGETDATTGNWKAAKGREMFLALKKELPNLQLVAEDLGQISEDVYRLKDELGLPGMRILQFHLQHRADGVTDFATEPNCVAYTGTHDNNTLQGWLDEEVSPDLRKRLQSLTGEEPAVWNLLEYLYSRRANTVIAPLQDVLGLPASCRMNRPGTPAGNWAWRTEKGCLTGELAEKLLRLATRYKR